MQSDRSVEDSHSLLEKNKLLTAQIDFLNSDLAKLRGEHEKERKTHLEDLEAARSDLRRMIAVSDDMKKENDSLKDEIEDYQNQLEEEHSHKELVEENIDLKKELRELRRDYQDVASQYEICRDQYNSSIFEANDLRETMLSQKSELVIKNNELKRLWREVEQNREDMASIMCEHAEKKNEDEDPAHQIAIEGENKKLREEVDRLKRYNDTISGLFTELQLELQRINQFASALPSLEDPPSELIQEGDNLESKGLQTRVLSSDDIHNALTLSITSLASVISSCSTSKEKEVIELLSSLYLVKKQLIIVNDETKVIIKTDEMHREALMQQDIRIDDLEREIDELREENRKKLVMIERNNKDRVMLVRKMKKFESEVNELKEEKGRNEEAEKSSSEEEIEESNDDEKEGLQKQIEALEREKKELQEKVEDLQDEIEEMREEMKREEEAKNVNSTENVLIVTQLKMIIAEKERLIKEKESALEDLEDNLDDQMEITEKLKKELNESNLVKNKLRIDIQEINEDNEDLLEELKEMKAKYEKQ